MMVRLIIGDGWVVMGVVMMMMAMDGDGNGSDIVVPQQYGFEGRRLCGIGEAAHMSTKNMEI